MLKFTTPSEKLQKTTTHDNLWMYILYLGYEKEIPVEDVPRLIYEQFGFLPNAIVVETVMFRLRKKGYISDECYQSKAAFKTTKKGAQQLTSMEQMFKEMLQIF
ncbi:MAG: hypothetical protein WC449_01710 [Candidatus Paceibacterota bacterium]